MPPSIDYEALGNFSLGLSTPVKPSMQAMPGKRGSHIYDDDISTAAPSPWMGSDLDSPWPSPMPGKQRGERLSFHLQHGSIIFPEPTVDFQSLLSMTSETTLLPPLNAANLTDVQSTMSLDLLQGVTHVTPPVTPRKQVDTPPVPATPSVKVLHSVRPPLPPLTANSAEAQCSMSSQAFQGVPPVTPSGTPRKQVDTPSSPSFTAPPPTLLQSFTPPPRPVAKMSALMKALHRNAVDQLYSVLSDDPEAAQQPLWEENVEPPLCAAVRLNCSPEIIELLLDNGADVNAKDLAGQTPLMICRNIKRFSDFKVDILGASMGGTQRCSGRVEELLMTAQAKTGILEDEPPASQVDDMDVGRVWNSLAASLPPPVSMFDFPDFFNQVSEPIALEK